MEEYIKRIDSASAGLMIIHIVADAMKAWVTEHLSSKEFGYIKGYADCKIKQLRG